MDNNPDPGLRAVSADAKVRGDFLELVSKHQHRLAELVTMVNERPQFGKATMLAAVEGTERALLAFQDSAELVNEFAEEHIGQL